MTGQGNLIKDWRWPKIPEYIDREALMDGVDKIPDGYGLLQFYAEFIGRLVNFPTADVAKVRHGRWHDMYLIPGGMMDQTCSCCQKRFTSLAPKPPFGIGGLNYCPNCGAKMMEE